MNEPCGKKEEVMSRPRLQILSMLFLLLFSEGYKKSDSGTPVQPVTPTAAPAAPVAPVVAPAAPPPPFSAAQKIGMFLYPRNNKTNDQQLTDEYAYYTQV